jgi:ferric-dicitrate binding protein FerR (iron transport regulator)
MLAEKRKRQLLRLLQKYQQGRATAEEANFVEAYYQHFDHLAEGDTASAPAPGIGDRRATASLTAAEKSALEDRLFTSLAARLDAPDLAGTHHDVPDPGRARTLPFYRRHAALAAAAVLILLIAGIWWLHTATSRPAPPAQVVVKNDADPGGDRATLTLAGGKVIVLDSVTDGQLAQQGNTRIVKLNNGRVAYEGVGTGAAAAGTLYNTLTTPVAGQYHLYLPDGTLVMLNSASSIRYPTAFAGQTREVEVDGEAWFQIKDDPSKPFIVKAGSAAIRVLGTDFNIMAYSDEPILRTTLVHGKVSISIVKSAAEKRGVAGGAGAAATSVILHPGQLATIARGTDKIAVSAADVDKETAWINGFFQFDQTDLPTLMRQLKRWYAIDPVYAPTDTARKFGGRIDRRQRLSALLELLEDNDIHFKIEGKKLIVNP